MNAISTDRVVGVKHDTDSHGTTILYCIKF